MNLFVGHVLILTVVILDIQVFYMFGMLTYIIGLHTFFFTGENTNNDSFSSSMSTDRPEIHWSPSALDRSADSHRNTPQSPVDSLFSSPDFNTGGYSPPSPSTPVDSGLNINFDAGHIGDTEESGADNNVVNI